jgi:hypothetical protein
MFVCECAAPWWKILQNHAAVLAVKTLKSKEMQQKIKRNHVQSQIDCAQRMVWACRYL